MQEEDLPKDYDGMIVAFRKLKEEFEDQNQVYEEYIASLERTKKEQEEKLIQKDKEYETLKKEITKLKEANADRNKDIEYLEKEMAKAAESTKQMKDKLAKQENRMVETELENTYYFNKIRELESWADELKSKLDAALEENIIIHSEYESFKNECDEKIQRIQEELEDNKNEVLSKEKMIHKLTQHRDFLVRTSTRKSEDFKIILSRRPTYLEIPEKHENASSSTASKKGKENLKKFCEERSSLKIPEKFINQISQTLSNLTYNKVDGETTETKTTSEQEFLIHKLQTEVKSILENRKTYLMASLAEESFSFDVLNIDGPLKLGKIKTAVQVNEAIDEVLMKIRERKEKVITQKRLLQAKFEKLGIKIN